MKPLKARKATREIKTDKDTKIRDLRQKVVITIITQIKRAMIRNTRHESSNISNAYMNRDSLASVIEY